MEAIVGRRRLILGLGVVGLATLGILLGRTGTLSRATATTPPPAQQAKVEPPAPVANTGSGAEYSQRVVAYIHDTIPITREELGEYLIARMGADRLGNLVNRKIIEHACKQKGIEVTAAEVEADLNETLKSLKVNRDQFVSTVLKPYQKTLYEWKEDVIKPRLLLTKLCRPRVVVTDDDLKSAYEAYYGEQIEARMIKWPRSEKSIAMNLYPKLRDSDEEFMRAAKTQADPKLAAEAGKMLPFGRYTTGHQELETVAFRLKVGEVSQLIEAGDSVVMIKCLAHVPPKNEKKLEDVREELSRDIVNRKIQQIEIKKLFAELSEQARPRLFLKGSMTDEDVMREARQELHSTAPPAGPKSPGGN